MTASRAMIDFVPEDRTGRRVLFTPGPVSCSAGVLAAAQCDIGSWDADTTEVMRDVSRRLLAVCAGRDELCVTLLPGSGTYGVEAMLGTCVARDGSVLVVRNGMYGQRLVDLCEMLGIAWHAVDGAEDRAIDPAMIDEALQAHPEVSHVALCHCETTSGVLHPLSEIGRVAGLHGKRLLVDAMATFCGYEVGAGKPIDFEVTPIDMLVASANKCVQGMPGLVYAIGPRATLARSIGNARSLSLDLAAQHAHAEKTGRFRFTPPTHVLLAMRRALVELEEEGGVAARSERYRGNAARTVERLGAMGIEPFVEAGSRSHICTTFRWPREDFDFAGFIAAVRRRGYILFPQQVTRAATFRIGSIGNIGLREVDGLCDAIGEAMEEVGVAVSGGGRRVSGRKAAAC